MQGGRTEEGREGLREEGTNRDNLFILIVLDQYKYNNDI